MLNPIHSLTTRPDMRYTPRSFKLSFESGFSGLPRQMMRYWFIALAILVAATGCGGGSSTPRFQDTTVNGIAGIRDNTTGLVWSKSLTTSGPDLNSRLPYASELLQLVHTTSTSERQTYFNFAFSSSNPPFTLAEAAPVGAGSTQQSWTVDVGGSYSADYPAGILKSQASTDPAKRWYLLFSATNTGPSVSLSASADLVTDLNHRLMWQRCVEGTTWNAVSATCSTGTQAFYTHVQASDQAKAARYNGYADWRVPTLIELQYLLNLDSSAGPYISASNFKNANTQVDWINVLAFRTATQGATSTHWSVDFRVGQIAPIIEDTVGLPLILVRSW